MERGVDSFATSVAVMPRARARIHAARSVPSVTMRLRCSGVWIIAPHSARYSGWYTVTAVNNANCAAQAGDMTGSAAVTVNPLPIIDIAPGVDTIKIKTNEQHTFNAGIGFSSYLWNDGTTNQTLFVDGALLNPGDYTYWAEVSYASGCIARDTAILNVKLPTGINSDNGLSISLFPNPNKGKFKLNFIGLINDKIEITIHNTSGMLVFKKEYKTESNELHESIDLDNCSEGVYFIHFSSKNINITRKIVVD